MDLEKNGKLLCSLRKKKGMTQAEVAKKIGVLPKTVSKWETGHGFPDVSSVSLLAEVLGVSSDTLLSGSLDLNMEEVGNMKKTKFYVCPHCGSIMQGSGECRVVCCGSQLSPLEAKSADEKHMINVSEIENDFYVELNHPMTKEHFIGFIAYVTFDRVLTVRLYPEQDSAVRFPKMHGGQFYYYCNEHGLFEYKTDKKRKNKTNTQTNLTALMSAFSRAYHLKNSEKPVFADSLAEKLFSEEEYGQMENYILSGGGDVKKYVNTQLAPTPVARAKFCEECLNTSLNLGTEQHVIIGSGLDTSPYRNKNKSLTVFEIDKENVIEDKSRRLARAKIEIPENVKLIAADLSKDSIEEVLLKNGFDKSKKAFFSCMGLFYYLSVDCISDLLKSVSALCAEGSEIVFDFGDNHLFSSNIPRVKNMLKMAEKSGAPMKSCFSYGEMEKLLEKHGFLIYEFLSDKDIQDRFFSDCNSELSAFEHINYALAVKK
ncbi:MAG: SAM-dependent methyltransferase [Clostridia bacterium]